MVSLHMHPYPPMRLAGFLSEAHPPGANTRSASLFVTPLVCLLMLLREWQGSSQQ
jgi:hypothetical protein